MCKRSRDEKNDDIVQAMVGGSRIGYIGLGNMGGAMAINLVERGWQLTLYARRTASIEPFKGMPVVLAGSPREVGLASDILCLCVVDVAQIVDVLFGQEGATLGLREDSIVVIHSTIAPDDCRLLASRLSPLRVHLVDAPVSGGQSSGRKGELAIAVGGDEATVARCMKLFQSEGSNVMHCGGLGSGQIAKLVNNGLFYTQLSLVDEMVKLGAALGLDRDMVIKMINSGSSASWASGNYARSLKKGSTIFDGETSYPGGTVEIMRKDVSLFLSCLQEAGFGASRMAELAATAIDSMIDPARSH
jgi:3-hydroxyisobutyrate dehydrogenase